jgi:hypothetical protein
MTQQDSLAGTAPSDDAEHIALVYSEIDVIQHGLFAVLHV